MQTEAAINWAAFMAPQHDDDATLDNWLASMDTREFETMLDGLAALDAPIRLEASA